MKTLLTITEVGMLAYWALAALMAAGALPVPPEYMYSDHLNPLVVAWNWSFLPIDIAFALCGLSARFGNLRNAAMLEIIGLTLMLCAGLMAISFWAFLGAFDPMWWGVNLWLMGLACVGLLRLAK